MTISNTAVQPSQVFPSNLHLSIGCPTSSLQPLTERVEQKFYVGPDKTALAFGLLWRTCRSDSSYPKDQVNSLYFDTRDLDQHERSDAGDYAKDKIRIRWYGAAHDPHRMRPISGEDDIADNIVHIWLERKTRRGFASTKQRLTLDVPGTSLAPSTLKKGIVPRSLLCETMARFGFFAREELCPVIAISYGRYRFIEPQSGFRVSLDYRIRSSMILPGIGRGERALELPGVVVEVKGPVFKVPVALLRLADIGSSWTRFSKYSSSIDGHKATMGMVSRLWPSGVMETNPGGST